MNEIIKEKRERFWLWECPSCKELLADPLRVKVTQCYCGQAVFLGSLNEKKFRHVVVRKMQTPVNYKSPTNKTILNK